MEPENVDMMEDGEVEETGEVGFKRENKTTENLRNSFSFDEEKLKKRAERFGIPADTTNVSPLTKEQLKELYESMEIPPDEIKTFLDADVVTSEPGSHNQRFEAIHIRGTEDMSTQNVFEYFKGYAPASIEWINDYSCNVVWFEPWQAARAIMERSTQILAVNPTAKIVITDGDAMMDHDEAAPIPAPPGGVWRLGIECAQAKALLMRFATRADRKVKGAERLSEYYRNYGNPNFGGMTGLISSSRKRRLRGKEDPAEEVDSKNPWGSLAEAWGASEPDPDWEQRFEAKKQVGTGLPSALVRRLGHQPPRPSPSRSRDTESENSDEWDSSDSNSSSNQAEGRSRKKRPRMRMYADEEEERERKKKLGIETVKTTTRPVHARLGSDRSPSRVDLRQRLGPSKSPRDPVTNPDDLAVSDDVKIDLRSKLQSRLGTNK